MKKKAVALMTILSILMVMSCPVIAAEQQNLPINGGIVQPRWTNISRIFIVFDKYGSIETDIRLNEDYRYTVTVELRKSNGSVVETWEEENGDVITSCDLESGVRYYVRAIVKVYNDSGKVIETATKNSSTITAS